MAERVEEDMLVVPQGEAALLVVEEAAEESDDDATEQATISMTSTVQVVDARSYFTDIIIYLNEKMNLLKLKDGSEDLSAQERHYIEQSLTRLREERLKFWKLRRRELIGSVLLPAFDVDPELAWFRLFPEEMILKPLVINALKTLSTIPRDLRHAIQENHWMDRDVCLALAAHNDVASFAEFIGFSTVTMEDREVALALLKACPNLLHRISGPLFSSQDFVSDVLRAMFDNNEEYNVWEAIVTGSSLALQNALMMSTAMQRHPPSKEVVRELQYEIERFLSDATNFSDLESRIEAQKVYSSLRREFPGGYRDQVWCSEDIGDNDEKMASLVRENPLYLRYATDRLLSDERFYETVIVPAFQEDLEAAWSATRYRNSKYIVLAALANHDKFVAPPRHLRGHSFHAWFNDLASDRDILIAGAALSSFVDGYPFDRTFNDNPPLRSDREVLLALATKKQSILQDSSVELLESSSFVGDAINVVGFAVWFSPVAQRTILQNQDLFVRLICSWDLFKWVRDKDEESPVLGQVDRILDEMTTVAWTRELRAAWLVHCGYFPISSHEEFNAASSRLYGNKSFMMEAIQNTRRLSNLYWTSIPHILWDFDMILAAVLAHGNTVAAIEDTFGEHPECVLDFARDCQTKLGNHASFKTWLLVMHRNPDMLMRGNETAVDLNRCIADLVDVPYGKKFHQLRDALAILSSLGYVPASKDATH